ncbi:LytR/AlgR family response regulator transcription factor [Chryseobacterium indoltheticum]|jgi:two-component system LytT family response regulator|uniref:LytR/AlgR family response regulator transcription factor n=1 Tax=Chryseobacterium indoltheticum TaxID=254 RepID=UPI00242F2B53|nr:LytTR family DNA-binding domain-containing protein [Chryseobacterium indoltheticum]MDF2831421.1 DNA-binding response regulator [Chryseobacterium indoltheticum]
MKIKSVIVDDEKIAREVLSNYLTKYCPQIEILGEAENIKDAVPLIAEMQPQLVFLDVEMPFGNAFDVLEATKEFSYETIFITAFSQYSLQALNKSASYYILKPIDIQELILAVNKVAESIEKKDELNRNKILLENLKLKPEKQQLILPTLQGFDVVKTEDIIRLQADGNFTQVYLTDNTKKMVCRFLKHFDDLLESPFVRVHRSHIINTNFVKSYHKSGTATLSDNSEIEVSGSFKEQFLKVFY